MNVLVRYGVLVDLTAALQCRRCFGLGRDRYDGKRACERCAGTGVRADGWSYDAGPFRVEVGSIVETEPTPHTDGRPAIATVIELDTHQPAFKRILRVIE